MPLVRVIAKQCLIGLDYLHRICEVIHTDLKPENIVLVSTDEQLVGLLDDVPAKHKAHIKGQV